MLVRTIKFMFVVNLDGMRWLWYMYYVAMIMIPMLALLAAMTMGKNDEYRLPGWLWGLVAISVGLVVFVLSNDFHQLVFSFPEDRALWHDDYRDVYKRQLVHCSGCLWQLSLVWLQNLQKVFLQ